MPANRSFSPSETTLFRLSIAATLAVLAPLALADRIEVTCAGSSPFISDSTLCDSFGSFSFPSEGPEVPFLLTLTAPATHCSDVSYVIFQPGDPNSTDFSTRMVPGESQNVEIGKGFGPGAARVEIAAIGYVGGRKTGVIGSWAVDASAAPVP